MEPLIGSLGKKEYAYDDFRLFTWNFKEREKYQRHSSRQISRPEHRAVPGTVGQGARCGSPRSKLQQPPVICKVEIAAETPH
jgi:hypothetical protein